MLNLGGLFFTLDADTRGLTRAVNEINNFGRQIDRAFRGVASGTVDSSFANGLLRQEKAVLTMLEKVKALQDRINNSALAPKVQTNMLKEVQASYEDFARRMSKPIPLDNAAFSRSTTAMNSTLKDTSRELDIALSHVNGTSKGFGSFTGVLRGLGGASLLVQGHLGGMSTRFFALTQLVREFGVTAALTSASVAGLSAGVGLITSSAITSGKAMQSLNASMTAVTGNSAVASVNLGFVKDVALQTGAAFAETGKSFTSFLAAAQASGLNLKDTEDSFRGISVAAATLQISGEDIQGVFKALEQMLSKGTVQSEELRGQLGDRFPAAFAIAAKAVGKTTAELDSMLKKRQVISSEFVPAFVKAAATIYNLDLTRPVDNLNVSLGRTANQWFFFGVALDKATGATAVYKTLVDALGVAFERLAANLPQLIGFLGGVAGGLIAIGTVMAIAQAWPFVMAAYGAATAATGAFMAATAGSTFTMASASLALGAAMNAIPGAAIVTTLGLLAAGAVGAYFGYTTLTSAVNANNGALADTSGIQNYITMQKQLGFQIASTTQEFIKQVQAQNLIASNAASEAGLKAARLKKGPELQDYAMSAASFAMEDNPFNAKSPATIARERAKVANDEAAAAVASARKTADLFRQLQDLSKLKDKPTVPVTPLASGNKGRKGSDPTDRIDDYVEKMRGAEQALAELAGGNRNYKVAEDLAKAREAINGFDAKQITKVNDALVSAGFTTGTLEERLGGVLTRTREAKESASAFARVWDQLDGAVDRLGNLNQQMAFLKGGGDPAKLYQIDAMTDASAALAGLSKDTIANQNALLGLQERMRALGIEVGGTGTLFENTRDALGRFIAKGTETERLVQVFSDLNKEMRDSTDQLNKLQTLTNAYSNGGKGDRSGMSAYAGEAAAQAVARGEAVRNYVRELTTLGASQSEINQKSNDYLAILRQIDEADFAYNRAKTSADAARDSLKSLVQAGSAGFKDLISGAKSFSDVLTDLASSVLDNLYQQLVNVPLNNFIDGIGRKKGVASAQGIDSTVAGLDPAKEADRAVTGLGAAADVASQAMNGNFLGAIGSGVASLITSSTTQVTAATTMLGFTTAVGIASIALQQLAAAAAASGGTSIIGSLLGAVGGSVGGLLGGGGTGGFNPSTFNSFSTQTPFSPGGVFGAAPGRALGGPMSAGSLYQINEPGISGEYFIPSVNGYMSNKNPNSGGSGSVAIDARTTIDARGATAENLADLKRMMAQRDQQLRQQLPMLIDSRVRDSSVRGRN